MTSEFCATLSFLNWVSKKAKEIIAMLLFKLLLTPLLIGLIGLAERKWGATVGGWLVGLPLTSAPLAVFIAIEQGAKFAEQMALGILLGLISQVIFCVTYAWLSSRVNWLGCWSIGWAAFGASSFVFQRIAVPHRLLPWIFLGVITLVAAVLFKWPSSTGQGATPRAPSWAIVGRMVIATSFILLLTRIAPLIGPQLSGLLSPLPIFATVFAIFAHKFQGAGPARQILRGVVISSFACALFFLVVGERIKESSILATFGAATLLALLTQGVVLRLMRRRPGASS